MIDPIEELFMKYPAGVKAEARELRHMKVYTLEQANEPAIRHLVQSAWEGGPEHISGMKKELHKKRPSK